ncbi:hypothetical protein T4D_9606 [Trichinella pseudospiralis]|uniref:Uncharacterized protein n=1 Tax=Trichinella pseudospiralis TaxID=6337 RepID=A0A0V1FI47_TRIPS|nr:hypothetical protein T4D_9606 [Trichinella pseudospiralis]
MYCIAVYGLRMAVALSSNDPVLILLRAKLGRDSALSAILLIKSSPRYFISIIQKFFITAQRKKVPKCCNWLAWANLSTLDNSASIL